MVTKEVFDEYGKKRLREMLDNCERPHITAGFFDYFGDGELTLCSQCGTPVLVRPWLFVEIKRYDLQVFCICCIDPQVFKGQLIMDLSRIEEGENVRKC